jgi:molybdopterin-guanine dinucleotide biosynthesis protein A
MKNVIGVVPAKKHSRRLPGKNLLEIDGVPLWERACHNLLNAGIEIVSFIGDIEVKDKDSKPYRVYDEPEYLLHPLTPVQQVLYWYLTDILPTYEDYKQYNYFMFLLCNNAMIRPEDIRKAYSMINSGEYNIVRSYDEYGRENCIFAIDIEKTFRGNFLYDVHTGSFKAPGKEIHYLEEYLEQKEVLE